MPSPFPGMDPYLEDPELWPDVHHRLISQIQAALNPCLRPKYIARIDLRVYVSDDEDPGRRVMVPDLRVERRRKTTGTKERVSAIEVAEPLEYPLLLDETIEEAHLTIRQRETGALVTLIEVVSPSNKISGARGRSSFQEKKALTLAAEVNWAEIDLLRSGERLPTAPPLVTSDYRVTVIRRGDRKAARYWPIQLRQKLPVIAIPLKDRDPDVPLDLAAVLQSAYEIAEYDGSIDYTQPPTPPLSPADAKWANHLLRAKGLR